MRFILITFLITLFKYGLAFSQHPINKLDADFLVNPKPIIILFHTDWCNYCSIQSKQIEKDTTLKLLLKESYYFIDFNAELEQDISFNGNIFKARKNSAHDFANSFFKKNKQIAFPAWIILDKNYNQLFNYEGLIKPKELKTILNYFLNASAD